MSKRKEALKNKIIAATEEALEKLQFPHDGPHRGQDTTDPQYVDDRLQRIHHHRHFRHIGELIEYYEIGEVLDQQQIMNNRRQKWPLYPFLKKEDRVISQRVFSLFQLQPLAILHFGGVSSNDIWELNDQQ